MCHFRGIFNCGEGTFRLMYARGFKFRFITNIFCTRNDWQHVGGIPSLARAIYDRCSQFPTFHGPSEIADCIRKFAFVTDLDPDSAVSDRQFNESNFYDDLASQTDFINLHRTDRRKDDPNVIAYITRLKDRPGKVDAQKISRLNISAQQKEKLFKGEDVVLEDGTIFRSSEVRTMDFPGANFLGKIKMCFFCYSC